MLITAHHALSNLAGGTLLLEIPERFHGLNLNRDVLATNDQIDAAVILLPDTAFDWDIEFLNLDMQAEPPTRDRPQMFVAMGFPWRETLVDYKARTLSLKTVNYWTIEKMDAYRLLHLSRDHFLLTNFDKEKALRGGVRRGMKAPHGMSGGALWRVWGFDGGTSSGIGLAGILTEYRTTPTKCMVSARVEVVQTMIEELLNRTTSGPSGHA
ncbi:MAG TPA: hypothetical protein VF006_24970 [Longimicrobium sp.]